jgi:hypothetical protein
VKSYRFPFKNKEIKYNDINNQNDNSLTTVKYKVIFFLFVSSIVTIRLLREVLLLLYTKYLQINDNK